MLKIIPLGGLGEIGLNMMVFEYDETMFIIDCGLMFPEDYMLGVDIVIPNFDYVKKRYKKISGIVLTHAHEDHIGALPYLLKEINAPVFGTPFALALVKHKLEEFGLIKKVKLHEIAPREKLKIGPFEIEFIRVSHSVIDGVGLAVRTPVGCVIHTGDFKINHNAADGMVTDVRRFAYYGEKGVLALLSDSTNVEKEGYTLSDQAVGETLKKIIFNSSGRVIIALFASNISRIQQIVNIARDKKCKILFNGRSILVSVDIAKKLSYLNIPHDIEINLSQVNDFSDKDILIVTTGSQGEPMSALARMSSGYHKQVKIKQGDTVILSSKFIPGNEKAITKVINKLYKLGAEVIYEKVSDIHVSGHAFQEELKLMINLTRPKFFMPIHGEFRHLILHSRLAKSVGIPEENIIVAENGQVICIDENSFDIKEKITSGRILVDGKGIGDVGRSVLKERRTLSEDGLVVVTIVFDEETGAIILGPEIISKGFIFCNETGHLLEDAKCVVLEIVEECAYDGDILELVENVRARLKTALKQYFYFAIKRRPLILPFIMEV